MIGVSVSNWSVADEAVGSEMQQDVGTGSCHEQATSVAATTADPAGTTGSSMSGDDSIAGGDCAGSGVVASSSTGAEAEFVSAASAVSIDAALSIGLSLAGAEVVVVGERFRGLVDATVRGGVVSSS